MKVIGDTNEMREYDRKVKEIAQSLAQQCNKLAGALEEAQPFIKSGAATKKLNLLLEVVNQMMGQLPALEGTGDIAKVKANIMDEINDDFNF